MFSIPIVKIDSERRLVYGRATDETPDAQGEVMDYASTKPNLIAWSNEQANATGGRSRGNLRSMHGQIAAGLIKDIQFDDHAKAVDIVARVVDDNEWEKVCEGVLTSFSLGGRYVRRWPDVVDGQAVMRYTAMPSEISLVDKPANPNARVWEILKSARRNPFQHVEETSMHIPKDENYCGRSTAAALIKAALASPTGDLADAFDNDLGKAANPKRAKRKEGRKNRREQSIMQGVSKALEAELAKAGMRIKGPTTSGRNGATDASIEAIRKAHEDGPGIMSPVGLPPQSDNAVAAPTASRADVQPVGAYATPAYEPPSRLAGTAAHSDSESNPSPPPQDSDVYGKALAAIRAIHRQGPRPMWET